MSCTLCGCSFLIVFNHTNKIQCWTSYFKRRPQLWRLNVFAVGMWLSRTILGTCLNGPSFQSMRLVTERGLYRVAYSMCMCSRLRHISGNLGQVLHIFWSKDNVVGAIILSISSGFLRKRDQNEVHSPTQTFYSAILVHICQISKFNIVDGTHGNLRFDTLAQYTLLFFAHIKRPARFEPTQDISFFHVVSSRTRSSFPRRVRCFLHFHRRLPVHRALVHKISTPNAWSRLYLWSCIEYQKAIWIGERYLLLRVCPYHSVLSIPF